MKCVDNVKHCARKNFSRSFTNAIEISVLLLLTSNGDSQKMASSESPMWIHFLKLPKPSSTRYHPAVCNYCQEVLTCSNENRLTDHILYKCKTAPAAAKVRRPSSVLYAEAASSEGPNSAKTIQPSVSLGTATPSAATSSTVIISKKTQLHSDVINVESPSLTSDIDDEEYEIESDFSGK